MMVSRTPYFALGLVVMLIAGCTERPSASSSESAAATDSLEAKGAAKRASTWQEARRRGVQFRAIGQEPGWLVEVTADSLRVEWDYGQQVASGARVGTAEAASRAALRYRAETERAVAATLFWPVGLWRVEEEVRRGQPGEGG